MRTTDVDGCAHVLVRGTKVMQGMAEMIRVAPQAVRASHMHQHQIACYVLCLNALSKYSMPTFHEVLTIRKCLVQLVSRHSVLVLGTKSRCSILKGCAIWDCVCHVLVIHRAHFTDHPSLCVVCLGAMATSNGCVAIYSYNSVVGPLEGIWGC